MHSKDERSWVAITYPQDFSGNGIGLGPETILRLQRIVDARRNDECRIDRIVLACGIGPETTKYPLQTKSFAMLMKEWLISEGTFKAEEIVCSDNNKVWNCIEVTLEMIRLIKSHVPYRRVLVVSAGHHIYPRMWITWRLLCRKSKSWELAFLPEWKGKYGAVHELLGTIKYIPLALWHRWKV